jgi:hypothetical protein
MLPSVLNAYSVASTTSVCPPVPALAEPDAVVVPADADPDVTAEPAGRVPTAPVPLALVVALAGCVLPAAELTALVLAATGALVAAVVAVLVVAADDPAADVGAAVAAGFGVSVALLPPHAARIALPAIPPASAMNRRRLSATLCLTSPRDVGASHCAVEFRTNDPFKPSLL